MTDHKISISHEDLEDIIRKELRETIKIHKKEMLNIEDNDDSESREDYIYSKKLINAVAIVLQYYSVPKDWPELESLEKEHEVSNGQ